MQDKELSLIKMLMDELQGEMAYDKDDFESRLGRKKPELEVTKIEGELPLEDGDLEMEEEDEMDMMTDPDESPEMPEKEDLMQRLMRLRK